MKNLVIGFLLGLLLGLWLAKPRPASADPDKNVISLSHKQRLDPAV